jgi:N-acetylglucosamine-6-phosphate deacetylase
MKTVIKNAKVIDSHFEVIDGEVAICDTEIIFVGKKYEGVTDHIIDAKGYYVSPGFIDIHVHGGDGYDFMDADPEEYMKIAAFHARFGTTAMVPTTVSGAMSGTQKVLEAFSQAKAKENPGAKMLGLHLEGPYVSKSRSGALDPQYIVNPKKEEFEELLKKAQGDIIRWTIAPELDGAMELGDRLKELGIIASIGHSDAKMSDVARAMEHGFGLVTHFYSCMSTVTREHGYRFGGVIEAGLYYDNLDVEIIADNRHLPPELLKLIYKIKGYEHIALVTDAMRGAGRESGQYLLGSKIDGIAAVIEDGVAKLMDRSAFAGSVATADRLVRTMKNEVEVPLAHAVYMMSYKPAQILGCEGEVGSLEAGKTADLVLFDDDIHIKMTIINGKIVYENKE